MARSRYARRSRQQVHPALATPGRESLPLPRVRPRRVQPKAEDVVDAKGPQGAWSCRAGAPTSADRTPGNAGGRWTQDQQILDDRGPIRAFRGATTRLCRPSRRLAMNAQLAPRAEVSASKPPGRTAQLAAATAASLLVVLALGLL